MQSRRRSELLWGTFPTCPAEARWKRAPPWSSAQLTQTDEQRLRVHASGLVSTRNALSAPRMIYTIGEQSRGWSDCSARPRRRAGVCPKKEIRKKLDNLINPSNIKGLELVC